MDIFSVRIISKTADNLRALDRFNLDLKHRAARQVDANRFEIAGVVTSEQMDQVKAAGYQVEIVSNLSQIATDRVREVSGVNRFADVRDVSAFEDRAVQGYMTAEEVESSLTNLHTLHPDLITLIELPHHTWEGRVSRAIRLRAGGAPNWVGVLFTGSMHAREWGGSDICLTFVVNLINAYRNNTSFSYGGKTFTAPQVRTILENMDIFLFPDVNPDGKAYSQTQQLWWRKNRNPNTPADPLHPGVDVNRNFDFLWNSRIGTSTTPSSETYRGSGPFSEPRHATFGTCSMPIPTFAIMWTFIATASSSFIAGAMMITRIPIPAKIFGIPHMMGSAGCQGIQFIVNLYPLWIKIQRFISQPG